MTDKPQHSPTPWRLDKGDVIVSELMHPCPYEVCQILNSNYGNYYWPENIPENCDGDEINKANAKHIVHCVNNHDALVEALEILIDKIDCETLEELDSILDIERLINNAKGE